MNNDQALYALQQEMEHDESLPLRESNLVFGEGDSHAEVVCIGEAPGAEEDRLQRPFVGRSGKLLTACLLEIGWSRDRVYITNIVKRRPPQNRDPFPEEIQAYAPYLSRQLAIIHPKVIVTLGRFSMNYFIPYGKITRDQGKIFRVRGMLVVPLFHPAAALRSTTTLEAFKKSIKILPRVVAQADTLSLGSPIS
ncbi:MAG: uracil-DNA glycosylase [Patescibacteria group bacterium]|nr:uracil-DNA glycosylase [Patescibacteria group bacterium]MDE2438244.1 uracil-DNA glycosylase [Patescibacteria group bacterium]